jgi:hypothetical protein
VSKAEAAGLAPKWRGGNVSLLENRRDKNVVLVYASEWQDEEAAGRMLEAYRKILKGKWKNLRIDSQSTSVVVGSGDDGVFRVWRQGNRVFSAEGMKSVADLKDLTLASETERAPVVSAASVD